MTQINLVTERTSKRLFVSSRPNQRHWQNRLTSSWIIEKSKLILTSHLKKGRDKEDSKKIFMASNNSKRTIFLNNRT